MRQRENLFDDTILPVTERGSVFLNRDLPKRKILFVDDQPSALQAFLRCFQGIEIHVKIAQSGREGLELIRNESFQVVVADFRMPGMDGIRFLEHVRLLRPDIVRIVLSGAADFKALVQVINRVGVFAFLRKPWSVHELRSTIHSALERHAMAELNRVLNEQLAAKCVELRDLNRTLEARIGGRSSSLLVGLMNALDLRDTECHWHSRRVALYSRRLAENLGLSGKDLLAVERGALLHDIGKIGVSDTILRKRGALTQEERDAMQCHAEFGYRIIADIRFLDRAKYVVWEHHERWDGSGYPRNLWGGSIDVGARVFAVIDTYDAMTNDRPYRRAARHEHACAEITRLKGILFDPEVVDAWNAIPKTEIDRWHQGLAKIPSGQGQL